MLMQYKQWQKRINEVQLHDCTEIFPTEYDSLGISDDLVEVSGIEQKTNATHCKLIDTNKPLPKQEYNTEDSLSITKYQFS
jgi:hypothetical protein